MIVTPHFCTNFGKTLTIYTRNYIIRYELIGSTKSMAKSANPRVNLTIPKETFDVLSDYAELHDKRIGARTDKQQALDILQHKSFQDNIDLLQLRMDLDKKND